MIYAVVVMRGGGLEDTFAEALAGHVKPRRLYVVGMTEEAALAAALSEEKLVEVEDPSAEELLKFSFAEPIGTEGNDPESYDRLLALAKNRMAQLQRAANTYLRR